jgi:hypothetical protein
MLVNTQNVLRKTHEETTTEERIVRLTSHNYLARRADLPIIQFLELRDQVLSLDLPRRHSTGYHEFPAEAKPI